MDVLDPNVVGWTDSGGLLGAPRHPVTGRERVARTFLRFLRDFGVTLSGLAVNGEPGVLVTREGQLISVIAFDTHEGLITRIHAIANPQKLGYVAAVLGTRP
jgi:RNA polymerase sigma-70 factor (ECF subfamily)